MRTSTISSLFAVLLGAAIATSHEGWAQQQSGCFERPDQFGQPAKVFLAVERWGDWFQITGQIYSSGANRLYRFGADGHSGAGRLYERHEYEAGAAYINVRTLTESDFVLEVEGYGVFHFKRTGC
jgi:hypothetical protein